MSGLLDELSSYVPNRNKEKLVESKALHLIQASMNLMRTINETYDGEVAEELSKRFLAAIKTGNMAKFSRGIKRINESRKIK